MEMEINTEISMEDNHSQTRTQDDGAEIQSILYMDQVGEICLTLESNGLVWKFEEGYVKEDSSSCFGIGFASKSETSIKFCDIYAVEFIDHETHRSTPGCMPCHLSKIMYRFRVHGVKRSTAQSSLWSPIVHTFGHEDKQTCQMWVNQIQTFLEMEADRPKNLLVFVNPWSGKRKGCRIWENVAPLFSQARVKTKVIVTERAGHAFDPMNCITNRELSSYDGVVAVGGDGSFNEILNGVLLLRHKAPYPPVAPDHGQTVGSTMTMAGPSAPSEDDSILVSSSQVTNPDDDSEISFPNERFRFGVIPCGSGDGVVISTTGARDPVTSALQIILGERLRLDIAHVVVWKASTTSMHEPCVRYGAVLAGYGLQGDVITESEKHRWMGPRRYSYAGCKVTRRHRSYEAEVAYMKVEPEKTNKMAEREVCRAKCDVCNKYQTSEELQESNLVRVKGRYISEQARKGGNSLSLDVVEHHKTTTFTFTSFGEESAWHVDGEILLAHKLSAQVCRGLVNVFASCP